jgi:hypothetical protein
MFDTELAIRMTVNATLPKMPPRDAGSADESDLALVWLDKYGSARTKCAGNAARRASQV